MTATLARGQRVFRWAEEDSRYVVRAGSKLLRLDGKPRLAKMRVYVLGQVDVEPPTVRPDESNPRAVSAWRRYRRAKIRAMRQAAHEAITRLVQIDIGPMVFHKNAGGGLPGYITELDATIDLYVTIKPRKRSQR